MAEPLLRLAVVALLFRLSAATSVTSGTTSDTASNPSESATRFGHLFGQQRPAKRPHIVVILADDLGWNDVSFHGSNQIPTPNIDALAYNGVILNSHYVSPMCTPSRATLMTGKYPIHTGMQHSVLIETEPRGLPLDLKLMPQFLREAGYKTHMVGKWHLGFFRHEYTPTYRGFDSHFGYWHGYQDYWSHDVVSSREEYRGYDMRRNMSVAWDARGKYSTDLFTEEAVRLIDCHDKKAPMFLYLPHLAPHAGNTEDPYQAPTEEIAKFAHIDDPERRTYAAMVSKLDSSVGEVVAALRRRGMLDNSVILFMADNGAPTMGIHNNRGSNFPLRGIKDSAWEGAVRGVAAIWSPLIKKPRRVSNQLFSIADWLPTFWSLAGKNIADLGAIDGVNIWEALSENKPSPRNEVLINIDAIDNYAAIRRGDYKYVVGHTASGDDWYGDPGRLGHKDADDAASDAYPQMILASRVSATLSGYGSGGLAMQNPRRRGNYSEDRGAKILSADEIQRLRREAIVRCNVKKEQQVVCNPIAAPCLFNIREDPCERVNLAMARPAMLANLEAEVRSYRRTAIPEPNISAGDPLSNPALWDGIWVNWRDPDPTIFSRSSPFASTEQRSVVSTAAA